MTPPKKKTKVRILLVDDHAILRRGMRNLIEAELDMEVVGEAEDGLRVHELVASLQPDIVILDLSMPELTGAEVLRQLKKSKLPCKVLVLTVHEDPGYLREMLEAGALGYMLKRAAPEELIRAIRAVTAGSVYLDSRLSDKLVSSLVAPKATARADDEVLTTREGSVLRSIAEGYSIKEIAATLGISVKTVETYKARSMEKLGLRSRVEIVRAARERGWLGKPAG